MLQFLHKLLKTLNTLYYMYNKQNLIKHNNQSCKLHYEPSKRDKSVIIKWDFDHRDTMLSYIINVQQDNRFLYSSIEPGRPLPSVPHPLIQGNRIQRHTGSGFTWLTFNYNYGSLMPINCHIAALVTIRGDWSLMRSTSQIRRKLKKTETHQNCEYITKE